MSGGPVFRTSAPPTTSSSSSGYHHFQTPPLPTSSLSLASLPPALSRCTCTTALCRLRDFFGTFPLPSTPVRFTRPEVHTLPTFPERRSSWPQRDGRSTTLPRSTTTTRSRSRTLSHSLALVVLPLAVPPRPPNGSSLALPPSSCLARTARRLSPFTSLPR